MDDKQLEIIIEQRIAEMLKNSPETVIDIYRRRNDILEIKVKEMQPKADFYDAVTRGHSEQLIRDAAKIINFKGLGEKKLFKFLRYKKILNSNNMPYQNHVDAGRFSYKISKWINPHTGETNVVKTPVVTALGIAYLKKILVENDYVGHAR